MIGINFRASAGFVTDGPGQTYCLGTDAYPTPRGGYVFGWETPVLVDARDRNSGVDPRLAGMVYRPNGGGVSTFRLDVSPDMYRFGLATGDGYGGNIQDNYLDIKDNTNTPSLITFDPLTTGATSFGDAAGNIWTNTSWAANNSLVDINLSTGILRITISSSSGSFSSTIAHIYLEPIVLGGPSLFRGKNFSFFDDEEVNRFEFWPATSGGGDTVAPTIVFGFGGR